MSPRRLRSVLPTLALGLAIGHSAIAQEATAYQINRGHTGHMRLTNPMPFPLTQRWAVTLPDNLSYPLIAGNRVFVLSGGINGGSGTHLYALDAGSGDVLWSKRVAGNSYWAAHTYGDGRVYVVNRDGVLTAFGAVNGSIHWSKQMPGQYAFSSAPTFSNGMVYVGGAGIGGTLYGVDATNGAVLWTASVQNGDDSSPAVTDHAVYVSYACNQAYKFDALTGALIWHHTSECEGGGGKTTVLSRYGLFTRDFNGNLLLDLHTGEELGQYTADFAPAFAGTTQYSLADRTLRARRAGVPGFLWEFEGDGTLSSAPIVVNGSVLVGASSGNLYALGSESGAVLWSTNVGAGIPSPDEQNVSQPLTGLAAGEGLLVVPAGNRLVAYGH